MTGAATPAPGLVSRMSGGRVVGMIAVVALLALVAGFALARVVADADAGSVTPQPGLITAPVERRALTSEVVMRADASHAGSVAVSTSSPAGGRTSVVTGRLPKVGAVVKPLSVLLEISGRPMIVLPGKLPAYRDLRVGLSGPDVAQLKRALISVGIDPGSDRAVYDAETAAAVGKLYRRAGYRPVPADGSRAALGAARRDLTASRQRVQEAQQVLATAQAGPTQAERLTLDGGVSSARRAVDAARRTLHAADASTRDEASDALADRKDALRLAVATRAEGLRTPSAVQERSALELAQQNLRSAERALQSAERGTAPTLPVDEVAFLTQLPRRVDTLRATLGGEATGTLLTVSGADLTLVGSVDDADAKLLKPGSRAQFSTVQGDELPARVVSVTAGRKPGNVDAPKVDGQPGASASSTPPAGGFTVRLDPVGLTTRQAAALVDTNVKVTVAVRSTSGEVLAVPLAAVSAGPGGTPRVEVLTDQPGQTRFVDVATGLAASGLVEIRPAAQQLDVGDKVVVGR